MTVVEPAGYGDVPSAHFSFQPKGFVEVKPDKTHGFILTRRQFLAFSATAAAVVALALISWASTTDMLPSFFNTVMQKVISVANRA